MPKPIEHRLMCTLRIANDLVRIEEREVEEDLLLAFIDSLDHDTRRNFIHEPVASNEFRWFAMLGTKLIAYAYFTKDGGTKTEFGIVVHQDWQRQGIGRLMASLAYDMAVRYSKRVIVASHDAGVMAAAKMLNGAGFDIVTAVEGEPVHLKMEIRR